MTTNFRENSQLPGAKKPRKQSRKQLLPPRRLVEKNGPREKLKTKPTTPVSLTTPFIRD